MFIILLPYTARGYDGYGIETVFGPTLEAFGAALIIIVSVAKSDLLLFRILNLKPVIWLGILSYSLYLWHSVFTGDLLPQCGISKSLWIPVSIGVAMMSYYLLELPFVRYRKNLIGTARRAKISILLTCRGFCSGAVRSGWLGCCRRGFSIGKLGMKRQLKAVTQVKRQINAAKLLIDTTETAF